MRSQKSNNTIFLALQNDINPSNLQRKLETLDIRQWIYLGEDSTWLAEIEGLLSEQIKRIPIADQLDTVANNLRHQFIDWIGDLSLLNDSREWWASEMPAKNPYFMLYERICLLAVGRELISNGVDKPTLIVTSTHGLFEEISSFATKNEIKTKIFPKSQINTFLKISQDVIQRQLIYILRRLPPIQKGDRISNNYKKLLEIHPEFRRKVIKKNTDTNIKPFSGERSILLFTFVDHRNFLPDGSYRDPYLGPLPQMLKAKAYEVAYVPRVLYTASYEETIKKLNQTGERFFFPDWFINKKTWFECQKAASHYTPIIPETSTVGDIPTYRLTMEHITQTRQSLSDTLLYEPLIAGLAAAGIKPSQIIHTVEGHSWEHALAWSVKRHMPNTIIVGYDNVTFSRMVLSMFPSQKEYGIRPLPDRLVTNGPLYRDILINEGRPEDQVISGCALRHTYLWKEQLEGNNIHNIQEDKIINILVATAIGFGDSVELIAKAAEAFGGNCDYKIIIKCHPLVNIDAVKKYLGSLLSYDNITFANEPIDLLLQSADILLYTYTTVCYEALQMGVAPIFVRSETFVNLDKLDIAPGVRWVAATPEDLRILASKLSFMSIEERDAWKQQASFIVKRALAPTFSDCTNIFIDKNYKNKQYII
ncbi:hypothetical protein FTO68_05580 [Methanocalculus taiwanensis]|uniref:Uncharacterized protein n=1 Tax=Methanocalculus taiwanensis TaxID=106207 RepID=A0ABD4TJK7_9EURY|nr:hypothetical protein [Methanocalculus taiwanensis]MCQ1538457.1 hypothetical protein [Methanocalculus taiwanensis]